MPAALQETGEIPMMVGLGKDVGRITKTNTDLDSFLSKPDGLTDRAMRKTGAGIVERQWVDDAQTVSGLMTEALLEALEDAKLKPTDLKAVFLASSSPDRQDGSLAGRVQSKAGLRTDIPISTNADACSGFVIAAHRAIATMSSPYGFVERGPVAVVAQELMSRNLSKKKSDTILFGDGGGAVIFDWRIPKPGQANKIAFSLGANGGEECEFADAIRVPAGGTEKPASHETIDADEHSLTLDGRIVQEYAEETMPLRLQEALERAGLCMDDISRFVFHQANKSIIENAAKSSGIDMGLVEITIDRYGNTSAGSIPITLYEADRAGRLEEGEYFAAAAFGGGFNSGAMVMPNPVHDY